MNGLQNKKNNLELNVRPGIKALADEELADAAGGNFPGLYPERTDFIYGPTGPPRAAPATSSLRRSSIITPARDAASRCTASGTRACGTATPATSAASGRPR